MIKYLFNKLHLKIFIPLFLIVNIFGIILFYNIPRVKYSYDSFNDYYVVSKVYGNSSSYEIEGSINGKIVGGIEARAFLGKSRLKVLSFKENNIMSIGTSAFKDCRNLKYYDFSKVNMIGNSAFSGCKKLRDIDLSSVLTIGGSAFFNCNLYRVKLENTLVIGSFSFYNNINLSEIDIPDSIVNIGINAFLNCDINVYINQDKAYLLENSNVNIIKKE